MAQVSIWKGNSEFEPGTTPFGFYDEDEVFQVDADKVSTFCATRLGYPLMDVELDSGSFYACFEEAVTTYGNEVFQFKIRENYLSLEGSSTGSALNNKVVNPTLYHTVQIAKNYGTEAEVGGFNTLYTGSLSVTKNKQTYDLDAWSQEQGIEGDIEIRKVFYNAPPAILRYFDPYAGTGTGIQSLMDAFDFGSMSPGVNFLMMPMNFDLLKIQAIELNDQIRKSAYSFELTNNKLSLFPVPTGNGSIRMEYYKVDDKRIVTPDSSKANVSTISEVPYKNPIYQQINSIGRQWIYQYSLALAKELLAYVRGKYQTVPVPGSEATLNQQDLLTDARAEKIALITNLRETLEQTSRQAQLERKANETENLRKVLTDVPYTIYVG
jgi:hypothetical protein